MRRIVLGVVAVALATAGTPATAAKPKAPQVTRTVLLFGFGGSAADIVVPKGAVLEAPTGGAGVAPGFAFLVNGVATDWAGLALISRSKRSDGKPVNLAQVHLPQPDHCSSRTAPTPRPVPPCAKFVEHVSAHGVTATSSGGVTRYALPAGTYQVVLGGPPNRSVFAALSFTGVRNTLTGVFARKSVATALDRSRAEHLVAAQATGAFTRKLTGTGMGVLGVWHTVAENEPGPFSYAQCVATTSLPAEPCAAAAMTGQAPPAGAPKPAYGVAAGAVSTTVSGQVTAQTPLLPAGTYTNSVRVSRAGRGPAAGAFVWWIQSDALK